MDKEDARARTEKAKKLLMRGDSSLVRFVVAFIGFLA
jgi:hypothetical protein